MGQQCMGYETVSMVSLQYNPDDRYFIPSSLSANAVHNKMKPGQVHYLTSIWVRTQNEILHPDSNVMYPLAKHLVQISCQQYDYSYLKQSLQAAFS